MNLNNQFVRALGVLLAIVGLASCGGSSDGGAGTTAAAFRVTVTADKTDLESNNGFGVGAGTPFTAAVTANVRYQNGSTPADGTTVTFTTSNSSIANVSDVQGNGRADSVQVVTSGGVAQALVHSRTQTGPVTVRASAFDGSANRTSEGSLALNVTQGPPGDPCLGKRLCLTAVRTEIPANPGINFFFGSPYSTDVTITYRNGAGDLAAPVEGEVGVSINPVTLAAFTTLDDPETEDINELEVLVGNAPVELAGGRGTVLVYPNGTPGTVTLSASAQDPDTLTVFSDTLQIEIIEPSSTGNPQDLAIFVPPVAQYIQQSGGATSKALDIIVTDPAGVGVGNPTANNVQVEVITVGANSGESLTANNQSGAAVSGTTISVATVNGVAGVSLISGSEPTTVTIRATSDSSDNNVDNGIQSAVVSEATAVISDGIPFSIEIGRLVGAVDTGVVVIDAATYSLSLDAVITDRAGNPPATPVQLTAGLIDTPLLFGSNGVGFALSGNNGNPAEGGLNFNVATGAFTTAGGGAGPGDTLVMFGKDSNAFADHESARFVDRVISNTSLLVEEPFNLNNTTGSSVDNGAVIPYAIGRARVASIDSPLNSNQFGFVNTEIDYPASQLGRPAIVYFQGTTTDADGNLYTFADVDIIRLAGRPDASLSASPDTIRANSTQDVLVCASDAAGFPLRFITPRFSFNLPAGTGSVDGVPNSGVVGSATGADGCTTVEVTTSGIPQGQTVGGGDGMLIFSAVQATAEVTIAAPGATVLQAIPAAIRGDGTSLITLRYLDDVGNPISGAQLTGSCEIGAGGSDRSIFVSTPPGVTNENGETNTLVTMVGFDGECPGDPFNGFGTCTFSTVSGAPTATVEASGIEGFAASPLPPGCTP